MTDEHLDETVWYVAYGSNLSSRRLQRYLDRAPAPHAPLEARPTTLAHRLFFAHESSVWTGGSAFIDPAPGPHRTLVVAWRLGRDQFLSVLAQENGRTGVDGVAGVFDLAPGETSPVLDRRYGLVVGCASPDHRPALTFTTPEHPLPTENRPSAAYVDTIVTGLVEHHGVSPAEARAYLAGRGA